MSSTPNSDSDSENAEFSKAAFPKHPIRGRRSDKESPSPRVMKHFAHPSISLLANILCPLWLVFESHRKKVFEWLVPAFFYKYPIWVTLVLAGLLLRGVMVMVPRKYFHITVPIPLPLVVTLVPHRFLVSGLELCAQMFAWLGAGDLFIFIDDVKQDLGALFVPITVFVLIGVVAIFKNMLIRLGYAIYHFFGEVEIKRLVLLLIAALDLYLPAAFAFFVSAWDAKRMISTLGTDASKCATLAAWLKVFIITLAIVAYGIPFLIIYANNRVNGKREKYT